MEYDVELDATGLSCPMPLMKLSTAVKKMNTGQVIKMIGTDPGSLDDIPKWCKRSKNELLETKTVEGEYFFWVKKN